MKIGSLVSRDLCAIYFRSINGMNTPAFIKITLNGKESSINWRTIGNESVN